MNCVLFHFQISIAAAAIAASAPGMYAQQPAPAPAGAPIPSSPVPNVAQIRIGPGDLIQVSVYDEPSLAQTIRVNDRGDADLQLLGTLHLAGLSTSEAAGLAERLLKQRDFLLDPHVSMLIAEYQTQEVSVLGEVKKPGAYQVLGARNLLDVISMAGGATPLAAATVTIKRRSGLKETVKTNLSNNPDELLASEVPIEPGDTIVVPRAGIVYVLGEVGRPGAFVMQDEGTMSLAQAIAFASGVSHEAAETKARVIRKVGTGFEEQAVNLKRVLEGKDQDPVLKADDIVYVPSSALRSIVARAPGIAQSAASAAVYQGLLAVP
jgi:polysaccharide export outer membrane protein